MIEIMKANDLPAGARIMGRGGRALSGAELATGLVSFVGHTIGAEATAEMQRELDLNWWPSQHLTFPNARIEYCTCDYMGEGPGIWLQAKLAHKHDWEFRWNDEYCDIREMVTLGPFAAPDDFREALGLPRTAQFRLPDGRVVTAELPGSALRPHEISRAKMLEELAEVPQMVAKPVMEDMEVVRKEAGEAVDRMETREKVKAIVSEVVEAVASTSGGFVSDFSHRFKPASDEAETTKAPEGVIKLERVVEAGGSLPIDSEWWFKPAETAPEELLAEPPKVETAPPPAEPIKPPARAGLKKSVKAGGRK